MFLVHIFWKIKVSYTGGKTSRFADNGSLCQAVALTLRTNFWNQQWASRITSTDTKMVREEEDGSWWSPVLGTTREHGRSHHNGPLHEPSHARRPVLGPVLMTLQATGSATNLSLWLWHAFRGTRYYNKSMNDLYMLFIRSINTAGHLSIQKTSQETQMTISGPQGCL